MPVPAWFAQPESMREHNAEVFAGCYDIPTLSFGGRVPVVIDIGACCGAFTLWSKERWPGRIAQAFEANTNTCETALTRNVHVFGGDTQTLLGPGVATVAGTYPLYRGKNNIGECSRWRGDEQSEEKTDAYFIGIATLPDCDVLKVDTEGEEVKLIQAYLETHNNPIAIMYEFHEEDGYGVLPYWDKSYVLARADIWQANRGVVCFLRRDIWEKAKGT